MQMPRKTENRRVLLKKKDGIKAVSFGQNDLEFIGVRKNEI
jgi:hypothetical protein